MDQSELHLKPRGICYRLYHFITKTLASQALKIVTLGRCTRYNSSSTKLRGSDSKADNAIRSETPCQADNDKEFPPTRGLVGDPISTPAQQAEEKNNPCLKVDEMGENMTSSLPTASLPKAKSLKKTVSINDNVEEILPSKKKKKSRSFQKSSSLDQEQEEPKPLRSILKVGSDRYDQSNSIC